MGNDNQNRKKRAPKYRSKGKKGNGYRSNRDGKATTQSSDESKGEQTAGFNDASWYTHNPNLSVASASIPFPYRPGMELPFFAIQEGMTGEIKTPRIPGVMSLEWAPTVGTSSRPTDPASIVGKEIYGRVRQVYSGSLDADAPDFVIYFMALDSIFSYIGWLKRLYRVMSIYTPNNYVVPDGLLTMMHFTDEQIVSLKSHKMQLFQVINELCLMSAKFKCPAVFDLFNRHYWMNDHVFTDAASSNAQMYMFNQTFYYKYALQDTPEDVQAGGCEMIALYPIIAAATSDNIVDALYQFGRELIEALAASDDGYLISGYLSRAFDGEASFSVQPPTMGEILQPVFSTEVLMQIENSSAITSYMSANQAPIQNNISQDPKTNSIICKAQIDNHGAMMLALTEKVDISPMLSIRQDSPSVVDVIEASRLMVRCDSDGNLDCGTEIPLTWQYLYEKPDGTFIPMNVALWGVVVSSGNAGSGEVSIANTLRAESYFAEFDYAPKRVYVTIPTTGSTAIDGVHMYGDVHNITVFTREQLKNIHKMCLYSEFNSFGIQ